MAASTELRKVTVCPAISILSSRTPLGYSQIIGLALELGCETVAALLMAAAGQGCEVSVS